MDPEHDKRGTVYVDKEVEGYRYMVMRGPVALCAYVGVPNGHPWYGKHYNHVDVPVHGGLTFSGPGDQYRPREWWWFGWDYGHYGDHLYGLPEKMNPWIIPGQVWTVEEVEGEVLQALPYFLKAQEGEAQ